MKSLEKMSRKQVVNCPERLCQGSGSRSNHRKCFKKSKINGQKIRKIYINKRNGAHYCYALLWLCLGFRLYIKPYKIINEYKTGMVVMTFERLYLCFRGPCSLIQHNQTIRENLELCSNIQIEISHNQLSGRHRDSHCLLSIFGNGQWILKTVGPYSPRKAFTNKKNFTNNTPNSEKS